MTCDLPFTGTPGCAGNAIQLTKDFTVVYAVEISKRRADMARNNAEVYGVGSQVEVRVRSTLVALKRMHLDLY